MIKRVVEAVKSFVLNKEPVAVISTLSAVVTAFVVESQGQLHGQDAWFAVGWAVVSVIARQAVTPVGKVKDQEGSAQAALDFLQDTADKWVPDPEVEKFSHQDD